LVPMMAAFSPHDRFQEYAATSKNPELRVIHSRVKLHDSFVICAD